MIRVLHTADLHLGRTFASWGEPIAETRRNDLLRTLDQIGQIACERAVSLVLIAGDLFDLHNPSGELVALVRRWLANLAHQRIPVVMIPGNHDSFWYERSVYRDHRFPSNTHLFTDAVCSEPYTIRIDGIDVCLYGIAHDHTRERDPIHSFARRTVDGVHIGLLHATVDPPPGFNIADRYLPLSSAQIAAANLDYIALGHIHRYQAFTGSGGIFAAQSGSPEPLALDEVGPRSVNLITFDEGCTRVERIQVGIRLASREHIDCDGLTELDVVERLRRLADPTRIVDVTLTGTPDENLDVSAIRQEAAAGFCVLSLTDRTEIVDSAFARSIENEQTIRGRFVRTLREQAQSAADEAERATIELALKHGLLALGKRSGA